MSKEIYISFGYNCDPRVFIKQYLGLSKRKGYKSCPFDLCISNFEAIYDCIDTDFKYFFNDLEIIKFPNAPGNRSSAGPGNTAIKNKYGIIFNHEGGGHSHLFRKGINDDFFYTRNNFFEFKKRYSQRINNFYNYLNNYNKIVFILKIKNTTEDDLKKLFNLLIKKYPEKSLSFKFIN